MKKQYNNTFKEEYYEETLDCGLKVLLFHKKDFISSTCAIGTPYGALMVNETKDGISYHHNPGIAHFLEHKLFETDDKDIMNDFARIGANVNAFTSYNETVYYFSSNSDIEKPLNMLLDFVYSFDVTEESVEKEKGIIIEELNMYATNPVQRLLNESYRSMYHNFPLKYDIGGNAETVNAISRKELIECYRINYHPSNMVLVVSTSFDPEKVINIIRNSMAEKNFVKESQPVYDNLPEPKEVVNTEYSFSMDVTMNKQIIAYKLVPDFKNTEEAFYRQVCLTFLLEACFTPFNPLYQKWLDEGRINDFFGYEVDYTVDYAYVLFYFESDNKEELKKIIEEGLSLENIDENILEQIKRKYIGIGFTNINQLEAFTLDFLKDYLEGMDFFKEIELIKSITLKDVEKSIEFVDKAAISVINLEKKEQ